jgi:hypothetical protein
MTEDFLGFGDPAEQRAAQGPAFIAGARVGPRELIVLEEMSRKGAKAFSGASDVIFTADDDVETGAEIWDPPQPPDFVDEGKRWQAIMRWPEIPSIADAEQFQAHVRRGLLAAWWSRLASARQADDAERPGSGAMK